MSFRAITYNKSGHVLTITLAHPPANAIDLALAQEIKEQSMIDALIGDGGYCAYAAGSDGKDAEMVAVWLKREKEVIPECFYQKGRWIRFQPANS